jgi:hypothetical protein
VAPVWLLQRRLQQAKSYMSCKICYVLYVPLFIMRFLF